MKRRRKIPMSGEMRGALDAIGGEPLEGSGFETETPEEGFDVEEPVSEISPGMNATC